MVNFHSDFLWFKINSCDLTQWVNYILVFDWCQRNFVDAWNVTNNQTLLFDPLTWQLTISWLWGNSVDLTPICDFCGGSSDCCFYEVTYDELMTLIDDDELVPWAKYLITDFQSTMKIGNTDDEYISWDIEQLVVIALTTNTISNQAYSLDRPQDEIWLDITNNYVPGDTYQYLEWSYNFTITPVSADTFEIDLMGDTPQDYYLRIYDKNWTFDINTQDTSEYSAVHVGGNIYAITVTWYTGDMFGVDFWQMYEEKYQSTAIKIDILTSNTMKVVFPWEPLIDTLFWIELDVDGNYFEINQYNLWTDREYTHLWGNEYEITLLTYAGDLDLFNDWGWLYAYATYKAINTKWTITKRIDTINNIETNYDFMVARSRLYLLDFVGSNIQAYDSGTGYVIGNRVIHNNVVYYCIRDSIGNTPNMSNTKYWVPVLRIPDFEYFIPWYMSTESWALLPDYDNYLDVPVISGDGVTLQLEQVTKFKDTTYSNNYNVIIGNGQNIEFDRCSWCALVGSFTGYQARESDKLISTLRWTNVKILRAIESVLHSPNFVEINYIANSLWFSLTDLKGTGMVSSIVPYLQRSSFNYISGSILGIFQGHNFNNTIWTILNTRTLRINGSTIRYMFSNDRMGTILNSKLGVVYSNTYNWNGFLNQIQYSTIWLFALNNLSENSIDDSTIWSFLENNLVLCWIIESTIWKIQRTNYIEANSFERMVNKSFIQQMDNCGNGNSAIRISQSNIGYMWNCVNNSALLPGYINMGNIRNLWRAVFNWNSSIDYMTASYCDRLTIAAGKILRRVEITEIENVTVNESISNITGSVLSATTIPTAIQNTNFLGAFNAFSMGTQAALFADTTSKEVRKSDTGSNIVTRYNNATGLNYDVL